MNLKQLKAAVNKLAANEDNLMKKVYVSSDAEGNDIRPMHEIAWLGDGNDEGDDKLVIWPT